MTPIKHTPPTRMQPAMRRHLGFSLVELMIAVALGLIVMIALVSLYLNITRTNNEMAKTNSQIENGRLAIKLMQDDIVHAGYWGGYIPEFDNLTVSTAPVDTPTTAPNPCLAYNTTNWDSTYTNNLIGINVQVYDAAPTGCSSVVTNKLANTDVLVVRHAATCVAGASGCEADTSGKLYFQAAYCEDEIRNTVQAATATTITLVSGSSSTNDFYTGRTIRIVDGLGKGQSRLITDYDGATKIATISASTPFTTVPDGSSKYAFGFGYVLDTSNFIYHKRDCTTVADKRKFVSHIYYVRDYANTPGDGIPALVRSEFDLSGGTLAHQAPVALIEGIDSFKVELGIDSLSDTNAAIDYTQAINWTDSSQKTSPTNRGDGAPEGSYVRCTTTAPCTTAQLSNAVAVKLYVLARSSEPTLGYTDTKSYTLGSSTVSAINDHYKRHVFSTLVRLNNISGRRETP